MAAVQQRDAEPDDLGAVLDLLGECGLPTCGIPEELDLLAVALHERRVVGVAGLELHDDDGLLRSVATAPDFRGRGVASQLCDEIERRASSLAARGLYLLTETAEPFFAKRGYGRIDRSAAPRGIASSREFTTLCPVSSALMLLAQPRSR